MKTATARELHKSFVQTLTIESIPHLFRFVFNAAQENYEVSVLYPRNIDSFTMTADKNDSWKIVTEVPKQIG